jgi:hypothetical protein
MEDVPVKNIWQLETVIWNLLHELQVFGFFTTSALIKLEVDYRKDIRCNIWDLEN